MGLGCWVLGFGFRAVSGLRVQILSQPSTSRPGTLDLDTEEARMVFLGRPLYMFFILLLYPQNRF